jgi:hypothetical protein
MSEWQPIESAPWDGTYVFVSDGSDIWISSRLRSPRRAHGYESPIGYDWYVVKVGQIPTHWMPLPGLPFPSVKNR